MVCCQFCFNLTAYIHLHLGIEVRVLYTDTTAVGMVIHISEILSELKVASVGILKHDMFFVLECGDSQTRHVLCVGERSLGGACLCSEVPLATASALHYITLHKG